MKLFRYLFLLLALIFSGCGGASTDQDDQSSDFIGKWRVRINESVHVVEEFHPDGSLSVNFYMDGRASFKASCAWKFDGEFLNVKILESEGPDIAPVGYEVNDKLFSYSDDEFVVVDSSTGEHQKHIRVKP